MVSSMWGVRLGIRKATTYFTPAGASTSRRFPALEFNYATARDTYLYAMALRKDVKNPFAPESDEVTIRRPTRRTTRRMTRRRSRKRNTIKIDFDGLAARIARVPVDADNYGGIAAIKGYLIYGKLGSFFYGRASETPPMLKAFSFKDRKESTVMEK